MDEEEERMLRGVMAAIRAKLPGRKRSGGDRLVWSEVPRALAVQLYCQYRLLGFGRDVSRTIASTDVYGHDRKKGMVKREVVSLAEKDEFTASRRGGNRSKQVLILMDHIDAMKSWLNEQARGKVTAAAFATYVTRENSPEGSTCRER